MFETLQPAPPDKILSLMGLFRGDPRRYKIDLGVGVYRDLEGRTPIMAAVREAERRVHSTETTKSYLGPGGDPDYCDLVARLVFADDAPRARLRAAQTPGGAGALRILCGLIARAARRHGLGAGADLGQPSGDPGRRRTVGTDAQVPRRGRP